MPSVPVRPLAFNFLRVRRLAVLGTLLAVILFHVWGNLYWIATNVTPLGRDAGGHLWRTLDFAEVLRTWTPRTLFQAFTLTNYRPPLLYVLVQPFYRLFGVHMDAAQYLNVALLALILALTFALGRRVFDDATGLLAAVLVGLWPMMAAMTRLFYMENLQTAMLLLILWTLLRADFFRSRRWSALWGLALGLGLLAKWTVPPLVVLPVVWTAWRGGVWAATWQALRHPRLPLAALSRALAVGALVAGLLYWPNRDLVQNLPLGNGLVLAWLLLWSVTALAFLSPPRPLSNFLGGAFLAAALASVWYLGRIDFVGGLLDAAFGTYGGNYGAFDPFRLRNYTRYPRYLVRHHWGMLGTALVLPLLVWAWGRHRTRLARHADGARLLWLTVLSTYVALSLPSQDSERNLVPLLPVLALLAVASLGAVRGRAKALLMALWLTVFGFQWALATFDSLAPWRRGTPFLWAESEFAQPPASGLTDPGYWIAPDVLETIVANSPDERPIVFGMLINSVTIHRGPYRYLIRTAYPGVELLPLTEDWSEGWRGTVRSLWLLTKDGDNHDVEPAGLRALHEVYENPDGFFPLLFEPVKRYPLPNGEVATLWRRTVGPPVQPPVAPPAEVASTGEHLSKWLDDWPLIVGTREDALWLALALDLTPERVVLARPDEPPSQPPTLFTVLPPDGERALPWLSERYAPAYSAWLEGRLWTIWARRQPDPPLTQAHHSFGKDVALVGWRAPTSVVRGSAFPAQLRWEGRPGGLKVSLRLVASDGQMIAQLDRELTVPEMPMGLFVPPDTPPGSYTLAVVVYRPGAGQPLINQDGQPVTALTKVQVSDGRER